jgi:hypothetical protein
MALGGAVTVTGPDNLSATTYAPGVPVVESGASFPPPVEQFAAAHYDRASRRVTLHLLGAACEGAHWSAHPDLHCVAVRTPAGEGRAVDLTTEAQFPGWDETGLVSRARAAWDRPAKGGAGPHPLPLLTRDSVPEYGGGRPYLYRLNDTLRVKQAAPWAAFTPQRDGKPLLAGADIRHAQLAGDVLAVALADAGERKLVLFRGPDGAVLGELTHLTRNAFALSGDGRLLARRDMARAAVVSETATPARPLASATHAGLHDALSAQLDADPFRLTIVIGAYRHTFRVDDGQLLYTPRWGPPGEEVQGPKGRFAHPPTKYDPVRFPPGEVAHCPGWRAVVDRLGQVLLFTTGGRLVAAFVVRRERAAAWIPGGVFWGEPRLIGGPPTPGAEAKIGRAILAAGGT